MFGCERAPARRQALAGWPSPARVRVPASSSSGRRSGLPPAGGAALRVKVDQRRPPARRLGDHGEMDSQRRFARAALGKSHVSRARALSGVALKDQSGEAILPG